MNYNFVTIVFPWLLSAFGSPPANPTLSATLAILSALIESAIAFALISKRLRTLGIVACLIMHSFLLLTLGPLGHNWNSIVWPWNITMMILVVLLFRKNPETGIQKVFIQKNWLYATIGVLFLLCPALSYVGYWDSYLSFKLYSGNISDAEIFFNEDDERMLPESYKLGRSGRDFHLLRWVIHEVNVPYYPEKRYYRDIYQITCKYLPKDTESFMEIRSPPKLLNGESRSEYVHCSDFK